jgi:ribosomal-protein-alanine N-acetyltransferase
VRTERLVLRRWRHDDLDDLVELFAQPEFWRYPFGGPLDAAAAERFIASNLGHWDRFGFGRYAVVLPESDRLIGYVGLQYAEWFPEMYDEVEVGWRIDTGAWGKGFATEGALAAVGQGFELIGLSRIIAVWEPANTASGRIADKLGMRFVTRTHDPRGLAIEVMRIERDEWVRSGASLRS